MKHQNLFVSVVGVAAWVHSTWSFSTVIGGASPLIGGAADIPRWLYWILPGAAAAAAVDVGLISLAAQFRATSAGRAKLVTFAVLSFISYLGQALFSLSHGGHYVPSEGLSATSVAIASVVWEVLIWALPAALPITLILWAWSDMTPGAKPSEARESERALVVTTREQTVELQLASTEQPTIEVAQPEESGVTLTCEHCGTSYTKATRADAQRALNMHKNRHCPATVLARQAVTVSAE